MEQTTAIAAGMTARRRDEGIFDPPFASPTRGRLET
jgi:hypothetical protein